MRIAAADSLALGSRGQSMILCVCVVFSSHLLWAPVYPFSVKVNASAEVAQKEGHTGVFFSVYTSPSAVLVLFAFHLFTATIVQSCPLLSSKFTAVLGSRRCLLSRDMADLRSEELW